MPFKKVFSLFLFIIILFSLSSCSLIRMGQESAEKIKTTSTHGYQNGIEPDEIRNIKDYIVDENDFVIIAESPYKTLYKTRNKSNMGRISILDDLMEYCVDNGGKYKFGKQFGASIASEYHSMDFEFSDVKTEYRKNRLRGYKGWMKCLGSKDDFEIDRKGRSSYFQIQHQKKQLQGYALQWYIDYFNIEDLDLKSLNIGVWSYSALVQFGGFCEYNKGKAFISNRYTKDKSILLNDYFLQQLNPFSTAKPYLLATGGFRCEESKQDKENFIYEVTYSKKYRKLLYNKRQ
ncbi:MAG: hypothetical protein COA44_14600 [Arcobacter sp.]|nr:MAG: hypothetical protein COA44_14600 [Arcobacter sp.]